jgi:hypothetical protein
MKPWRRHTRRQAPEERQRIHVDRDRAIGVSVLLAPSASVPLRARYLFIRRTARSSTSPTSLVHHRAEPYEAVACATSEMAWLTASQRVRRFGFVVLPDSRQQLASEEHASAGPCFAAVSNLTLKLDELGLDVLYVALGLRETARVCDSPLSD